MLDSMKGIKGFLKKHPILWRAAALTVLLPNRIADWYDTRLYRQYLKKEQTSRVDNSTQKLAYEPLLSVIVPAHNTPKDFFWEMVGSVVGQSYQNWELILVDDASSEPQTRDMIREAAENDDRIRVVLLKSGKHISGATNEGIEVAKGDYLAFMDHDDILLPEALYEITKSLNHKKYRLLYTNSDKIDMANKKRYHPFFKPSWNHEMMRAINYITHLLVVDKGLVRQVGGFDSRYDGAQDWEFILRCARSLDDDEICHIPEVLYNWRNHLLSTAQSLNAKPYALEAARRSIQEDLVKGGYKNATIEMDSQYPGQWRTFYRAINEAVPSVAVVLMYEGAAKDVKYIRYNTNYGELSIYDLGEMERGDVRDIEADYLVVVDKNMHIKQPDWVEIMLDDAARPEVSFVLAGLGKSNRVIDNLRGQMSDVQIDLIKSMTRRSHTKHYFWTTRYNISEASGGVLMCRRDEIAKKGLLSSLSDLKALSRGLSGGRPTGVYNPFVEVVK